MSNHSTQQSGHETRSAKTRSQLIEATIEVISAVGYEGASTRALAKAANTTLSAIPYHFGGKKELYIAAAHMIADYAACRFEEAMAVLEQDDVPDKGVRLEQAFANLLQVILENAEPSSWTSFVARCTYDNDEAFAVIYERAISPMTERLVHTAAEIFDRSSDDEALRLRISATVTAIVSFRFLRGFMLRGMSWTQMRPAGVEHLEDMVRNLCRSDFLFNQRGQ